MDTSRALSFVATIIMFVFAAIVLRRFALRRSIYNLFWGIGLLMFAAGAFAEGYLASAWNDPIFRSWYAFGALLNAAWLGHGSLTLLVNRRWVRYLTVALVVLSVLGLLAIFATPLTASAYSAGVAISEQYKNILPKGGVRLLTPFFNVYGTLFLVGGAVYSAYLLRRKQTSPNRMVGNLLIAAGALAIASAGTLARFAFGGLLPVSELTAAVLMFAGFMLAAAPLPAPAARQAAPSL